MYVFILILLLFFVVINGVGSAEGFQGNLSASNQLGFSFLSPYERSHVVSPHTYRYLNDAYTDGNLHGMFYGLRYDYPRGCKTPLQSPLPSFYSAVKPPQEGGCSKSWTDMSVPSYHPNRNHFIEIQ